MSGKNNKKPLTQLSSEMDEDRSIRTGVQSKIRHQFDFEKLLSELSSIFIDSRVTEIDSKIEYGLEKMVVFFDIDRAGIFKKTLDGRDFELTHSWTRPGQTPIEAQTWSQNAPWVSQKLFDKEIVAISRLDDLPEEAEKDKAFLRSIALKSKVTIPLVAGDEIIGIMTFCSLRKEILWPQEIVDRFKLLGKIFAGAIFRKAIDSALKTSEEYYRTLFENAQDGIFIMDGDFIIDCNDMAAKIFKCEDKNQLIGKTPIQLSPDIQPDGSHSKEKGRSLISKAINGQTQRFLWEHIHLDGSKFVVEVTLNRIDVGAKKLLLAIIRDFTERRQAEESLRLEKERAQGYFDIAGSIMIVLDSSGKITLLNKKGCEILGCSSEEVLGKDWFKTFLPAHLRDEVFGVFKQLITGDIKPVEYYENPVINSSGQERIIAWHNSFLKDGQGNITGILSSGEDITERKRAEKALKDALEEVKILKDRLEEENIYLKEEIKNQFNYEEIVGQSAALRNIIDRVEQVAPTDASVLIYGETGTGKELIARAIHHQSGRKNRPLIKVNCATIPRDLFESEFFGHVKGAFTGAHKDRIGRFQLADGGTLFLDEIGEIPLELQGKLLRVLQEGEFERIGEDFTRSVDVRIIASTNRYLEEEVIKQNFRQDLYFRLNVFPIEVPPLRDRREDISLLAKHFMEHACRRIGIPEFVLKPEQIRLLQNYVWPGNVRELGNVIERSVIISRGAEFQIIIPSPDMLKWKQPALEEPELAAEEGEIITQAELRKIEIKNIRAALEKAGWKVYGPRGAAELLNMKPSTLSSRIKALNIKPG
jgi:formate hydrogenlyase transcriptional activator